MAVKKEFRRHFRIYLVNNHPALIVDEDSINYYFHRTTESKTSGGKKNWETKENPLKIIRKENYISSKRKSVIRKEGFLYLNLKREKMWI